MGWWNARVSLTDGEVAVLADQVAGLIRTQLPGSEVSARFAPTDADDPYRWPSTRSWAVYFDVGPQRGDTIAIGVSGAESATTALFRLVDGLDELSETATHWGVAFPACLPGHRHPARVDAVQQDVLLRCPKTGEVVQRLRPELG